ncbi:uncharacterized protein LOC124929979 [Impatiens glandulifera]|uniref:uncharacterized protein LOC124929979 n=1 Tax=Impatiens glandulifera TaxID=253017 RepID=UPI001FB17FC9|nr:uncharacterized protein LOC124929979 [Impatiens glandulifera]
MAVHIPTAPPTYHHINVSVQYEDNSTSMGNGLPKYSVLVCLVNMRGEFSRSIRGELITDGVEIGPKVWINFEHILQNDVPSYVNEWLKKSDVQLDARTEVENRINNFFRQSWIKCRFSMHCWVKYDICKIIHDTKSTASESERRETCVVCLEKFNVGVEINKMLHCNHVFHHRCIINWMTRSSSCPLCRTPVISHFY